MHRFSDDIDFSATWVYGTGRALTLPESTFQAFVPSSFTGYTPALNGFDVEIPSAKNAYRTSPYHRADVSLTFQKTKKHYERSWIFSVQPVQQPESVFSLVDVNEDGSRTIRSTAFSPSATIVARKF